VSLPSRDIPPLTRLLLAVRAGGRCEFDGCNKYLFRHSLTRLAGNFAQIAHIVAFSQQGPRRTQRHAPEKLNDPGNLMLLCPECHKLIDDHPERFTVKTLKEYKRRHEERIAQLTGTKPDYQTTVVILKANIGGHTVDISEGEIQEAIAPHYPDGDEVVIDLTTIPDGEDASFWENGERTIQQHVQRLYAPRLSAKSTHHISLFALAPIPLLTHLGSQLSNKIPVDLYQRHRDTEDWTWKAGGEPVNYMIKTVRRGTDPSHVALLLSLSGTVHLRMLPAFVDDSFSVYEITLVGIDPNPTYLRLRQDLSNFQRIYLQTLGTIMKESPRLEEIHLFPAAPAPVAVLCGRELLPKVHPSLLVYDYNKRKDGFIPTIRINAYYE
jgi:hypothetical protein